MKRIIPLLLCLALCGCAVTEPPTVPVTEPTASTAATTTTATTATTATAATTTAATTAATDTTTAATTTAATTTVTVGTTVRTTASTAASQEITVDGALFRKDKTENAYRLVRYTGDETEVYLPATVGDADKIYYAFFGDTLADTVTAVHLPEPQGTVIDISGSKPSMFPATSHLVAFYLPQGAAAYDWGEYKTEEGLYRPELFYSYVGFRIKQEVYLPASLPLDLRYLKIKCRSWEETEEGYVFNFAATNVIPEHTFTIYRF